MDIPNPWIEIPPVYEIYDHQHPKVVVAETETAEEATAVGKALLRVEANKDKTFMVYGKFASTSVPQFVYRFTRETLRMI